MKTKTPLLIILLLSAMVNATATSMMVTIANTINNITTATPTTTTSTNIIKTITPPATNDSIITIITLPPQPTTTTTLDSSNISLPPSTTESTTSTTVTPPLPIVENTTPVCGNGIRETGEQCDSIPDSCPPGLYTCDNCTCMQQQILEPPTTIPLTSLTIPPECGNLYQEVGEECDTMPDACGAGKWLCVNCKCTAIQNETTTTAPKTTENTITIGDTKVEKTHIYVIVGFLALLIIFVIAIYKLGSKEEDSHKPKPI